MPGTAAQLARQMKIKKFDKKRAYQGSRLQPDAGCVPISASWVERFDGSYVLGVASYNAGASRVAEWVRLYGDPRDNGHRRRRLDRDHPIRTRPGTTCSG